MFKRIKKIFFLISIILFILFILKYYFSEKNKIKTIKLRTNYIYKLSNSIEHLPILLNDTNNIIEYNENFDDFKIKKEKRKFRDLLEN
tara:strand:+ start:346 stop:609 length:264 start_codon:yes stop_codon:yes gene_type:complete